jgi:hypothetical protein
MIAPNKKSPKRTVPGAEQLVITGTGEPLPLNTMNSHEEKALKMFINLKGLAVLRELSYGSWWKMALERSTGEISS